MAKKPSLDDVWGVSEVSTPRRATPAAKPKREEPKAKAPAVRPKRSMPKAIQPQIQEKPVRMTLYLDPVVADMLDRSQMELKKLTGIRGHSISNSAVIEECVKMVLDHFLKKGGSSQLPANIVRREADRIKKSKAAGKN